MSNSGVTPDEDTNQVRIKESDITESYLINKLSAGAGVILNEATVSGFDTLELSTTSGVFGGNYQPSFTEAEIQTSSGSFATIQTLIPSASLPSGNYLLIFQGLFEKSVVGGRIETRFLLNGGTETSLGHVPLPEDDYFYTCQSRAIFNTSGTPTFTFQWRKSNGGGNIKVRDRLLTIWRLT